MHTEKVQDIGNVKETVFLQCVKHVIKDPCDGHPYISPEAFNSENSIGSLIKYKNVIQSLTAVSPFHSREKKCKTLQDQHHVGQHKLPRVYFKAININKS